MVGQDGEYKMIQLLCGDCREVLPTLDAASFHAVVTDPPYHLTSMVKRLSRASADDVAKNFSKTAPGQAASPFKAMATGFMGKAWDGGDVAFRAETWVEVLRVLKPGGFMVCFGGTRTQHRLACAIEDAGFEIRDTLCWLYGSGFPKSHDVSKAIDAVILHGNSHSRSMKKANEDRPGEGPIGATLPNNGVMSDDRYAHIVRDQPATPEAAAWAGWGSALKPAFEPIILARKPLDGTIAGNVLKHGVGGINIDACRVEGVLEGDPNRFQSTSGGWKGQPYGNQTVRAEGRFPANVLHDGSDEVMAAFAAFGDAPGQQRRVGPEHGKKLSKGIYGDFGSHNQHEPRGDSGSAARFFYCAKADKADRADSKHPTVKPLALMEWLVKLITPPGGAVLDPFAGSGITAEACMKLGFDSTLIDIEADHVRDIRHRMGRWSGQDTPLFAEVVP
jgi:DNA modification methylase